ncbi:hypothetical protein FPQ10_10295 [Allobacillus sp. SKP2-8]|uniref:Swt1 family HEPN domain-containing protein n=1 Tax=unclassified Allobacillus TaxID=2628859 RepID=UPI0011821DDA|nr:Swt1 family HEPN domain-containing protein [Allobacillus sp. SKP2-8]TSJ65133.1 hypothetical protein FPQ10_10295 [Allobacillus sp. SKP2-8]
MSIEDTEFMKQAYGMLYDLENQLRKVISITMTEEYGSGWLIQAPLTNLYKPYRKNFSRFYLHELVSMLSSYECFSEIFKVKEIAQLKSILPIRNKIAHCKLITKEELRLLSYVLGFVNETAHSIVFVNQKINN